MLHIKLKGITKCSNIVANILPADPPPSTLGIRSIGQNLIYAEHGHVAYQIKGNHEMLQHGSKYFARRPSHDPRRWGQKVKIQLFQNMVMLHIRLKGISTCSNMIENILPKIPSTPPDPGDGSIGQIQLFQNMFMLHIKELLALRGYFGPFWDKKNEIRFSPNSS